MRCVDANVFLQKSNRFLMKVITVKEGEAGGFALISLRKALDENFKGKVKEKIFRSAACF